jgi:hypothetical protein
MLRQWSYKEHWLDKRLDLPGSLYGDPKLTRMHLGNLNKSISAATCVDRLADHCIEVLRANLMCEYALSEDIYTITTYTSQVHLM